MKKINGEALNKVLIIQTAFIGDAILATPVIEALANAYPKLAIDLMVRKGNDPLFANHPKLNKTLVWDKKNGKYKTLFSLLKQVRKNRYDAVINLQRFSTTGFFTTFSKAKYTIGFERNPWAFAFSHRIAHIIQEGVHETQRNLSLLGPIMENPQAKPALYPTPADYNKVKEYKKKNYLCVAPTSVWFTKQFPKERWVELFNQVNTGYTIYLLGAPADSKVCDEIITQSKHTNIINLAGKISLLQSAALMQDALMNWVNDSAPMHLASAVNANTTAIYCSTVPSFGFGPLADIAKIVEVKDKMECRPCGLHGHKNCPENHFNCAHKINAEDILSTLH